MARCPTVQEATAYGNQILTWLFSLTRLRKQGLELWTKRHNHSTFRRILSVSQLESPESDFLVHQEEAWECEIEKKAQQFYGA